MLKWGSVISTLHRESEGGFSRHWRGRRGSLGVPQVVLVVTKCLVI